MPQMKTCLVSVLLVILLICGCGAAAVGTPSAPDAKVQYTCTMHPEVISDKPGKCPKCDMQLVPKK